MTMLLRSLLFLASVAIAVRGIERRQGDDDFEWSEEKVFGVPGKVQVGEEITLRLNFSVSKARYVFVEDGYRKAQIELSRYIAEDRVIKHTWCVLEPCVLPNVTSIETTIPKQAFPDGAEVILGALAFDTPSQLNASKANYTAFIDEDVPFMLEGGDGHFSDWEKQYGWIIVSLYHEVPCGKVPCVRSCIEEHLNVDEGHTTSRQSNFAEFEKCVAGCGVKKMKDRNSSDAECITENSGWPVSAKDGSNPDGDNNNNNNNNSGNTGDGNRDEDSAMRLGGLSIVPLLGGLFACAMLAM